MWQIGQRVVTEFEPELGLGVISAIVGNRLVEVEFPTVQISRRYTLQAAPLRRVVLGAGQKIRTNGGQTLTIQKAEEKKGLILYQCDDGSFHPETDIERIVEDETPLSRFLLGQWAAPRTFPLRHRAWSLKGKSLDPATRGLVGGRVSLLPHQLYIASEVARRELPRVLLADEVGLGKTIESGLIFSSLRALERADRVLIVVPEALEHQWLAEMFRRFQEMFSVIDEARSEEEDLSQGQSAFEMNQRIICSLPFLEQNAERLQQAMETEWDLLIVDEAHRLQWSQQEPSIAWEIIRLLSTQARGLLLLTATPERRGPETEFGLLHLVDPQRFPNYESFLQEHQSMRDVAKLASRAQSGEKSPKFIAEFKKRFGEDTDLKKAIDQFAQGEDPADLLAKMVDRHGTGRVLMRNRRNRLKGFPDRNFVPLELEPPAEWQEWHASLKPAALDEDEVLNLAAGLTSGTRQTSTLWLHSRATALLELLHREPEDKVLLICSSVRRVEQLQTWLRNMSPAKTAIFHEELEIVERDRQAAWFAQSNGARVLLCSEIGGEGRNFQFCRHLFLFDLPLHPDGLEQRIGRLDRIGQTHAIQSHVPYFKDTPEEVLARWYAESLELFTRPWNGGSLDLEKELADTAEAFLPKSKAYPKRREKLDALLRKGKERAEAIRREQQESIDILIDINSFDESKGKALAHKIRDIDDNRELRDFLDVAFDQFGVDCERLDDAETLKISAHSLTFVENFPGLTAHGELLATYNRDKALAREELSLLTWEHPVAQGALSLILEGTTGRMAAGVAKSTKLPARAFVELLYVLQPSAPAFLEVESDLPLQVFRISVSLDGDILHNFEIPENDLQPLPPQHATMLLPILRDKLPGAISAATAHIRDRVAPILEAATERRRRRFASEQARLKALAAVNPLLNPKEIKLHAARCEQGIEILRDATVRLDAIRLVVGER
jgi:ATP-dependent helicase HepA